MNIFKKKSRLIWLTALLLVFCFVCSSAMGVFAAEDSGVASNYLARSKKNKRTFAIEVDALISAEGDYYTLSMDIENPESDFSGIARVQVEYNGNNIGYDVDISIPSGSTKTYSVRLPKAVSASQDAIQVTIFDKNDNSVYMEKFKSVFSNKNVIGTGILSDTPEELSFLDNGGSKVVYSGVKYNVKLFELDGMTINDLLDSIRILVIDNYDTSTLSEETIESIKEWVNNGGMLILGTGENEDKAFSGFNQYDESFIGAEVVDTYSLELHDTSESDSIIVSELDLDSWYDNSIYTSFSHKKYISDGAIAVFDIAITSFDNADYIDNVNQIYVEYIEDLSYQVDDSYSSIDKYNIQSIQGYMEKPARTGSALLIFLMIVYVALVGPIIYLILKAMNKREKIWICIPAISLIFVIFVFLISLGVRVKGLTLKSVTAINVDNNTSNSYVFGYVPEIDEWSVKSKEPVKYGTLLQGYYNGNELCGTINYKNDGDIFTYYPQNSFDTGVFNMCYDFESKGDFDLDIDNDYFSNGVIDGKVTNNTGYDFDFVLVRSEAGEMLEEDVRNGDTIDLDISNGSSYMSSYMILNNYARKRYDDKRYDEAAEIASIALIVDSISYADFDLAVIGVRKRDSVTTENEPAWECWYKLQ